MWNIEEITGYKPITTFWQDFSIADKEWKTDYMYLTELVMVLNWKMWQYSKKDFLMYQQYRMLFEKADEYAMNNLKGKELSYYITTTD